MIAGARYEPLRIALAIVSVWTAVAVLGTVQYTAWRPGDEASFLLAVALNGIFAVCWAIVTPFVLGASSALWSARTIRMRALMVGVLLAAPFAVHLLRVTLLEGDPFRVMAAWPADTVTALLENAFPVLLIVLVTRTARLSRLNEQRRRDEAELASAVAEIQLQQLHAALEPHFLFNALNSVAALIRDDPPAARDMMRRLADLLDRAMVSQQRAEIPLGEELAFARDYLAIQKIRFGDRLDYRFAVAPALESVLVPPLILQPLIENAVVHGITRSQDAGTIEIRAARGAGRLLLVVRDSGSGFEADVPPRGIGIANVRARLALLYGAEQSLEFRHDADGFTAVVELPSQSHAA